MTRRESERGAALVVTLVFAAAMAAAAVAFIGARQSDAVTMRAQAEAVQAQAALHAALQQTVALIANKTSRQIVPPQLSWTFDGVQVRVTLENEAGKVDINKAEEPLLRALPLAVGLRDTQAAALADTILDWRDENKLKRKNGAEDRDYAGAQRGTSGAANRPFAHPAELRYLPPVDAGVWARLAPLITIYSGSPTPETTKAPAQVRRALTIARGLAPSHDPSDSEGQDQGQGPGRDASGASAGLQVDVSPGGSGMASGGGRLAPAVSGTRESGLSPDAGRSSFASGNRTDDGEDARDRRNGDGHDASGVQTVMLDVRFPNGYEAAARAVISLNPDSSGGSEPFVMLDWTPFIPDQGGKP